MSSFFQYLKDTRGELRHVAWPTQFQTIIYTIIVAALSIFVALYLGLFDYIFTKGLRNVVEIIPAQNITVENSQQTTTIGTSTVATSTDE